ncbi:hypothetical protein [Micromonospora sp. NPDC005174]
MTQRGMLGFGKVRKALVRVAVVGVVASGAITVVGQPAWALSMGPCRVSPSKTSTATNVENVDCVEVQARIDRYESSVVKTYTGPIQYFTSFVSNSRGTNAGNAVRANTGSSWTNWDFAPW